MQLTSKSDMQLASISDMHAIDNRNEVLGQTWARKAERSRGPALTLPSVHTGSKPCSNSCRPLHRMHIDIYFWNGCCRLTEELSTAHVLLLRLGGCKFEAYFVAFG